METVKIKPVELIIGFRPHFKKMSFLDSRGSIAEMVNLLDGIEPIPSKYFDGYKIDAKTGYVIGNSGDNYKSEFTVQPDSILLRQAYQDDISFEMNVQLIQDIMVSILKKLVEIAGEIFYNRIGFVVVYELLFDNVNPSSVFAKYTVKFDHIGSPEKFIYKMQFKIPGKKYKTDTNNPKSYKNINIQIIDDGKENTDNADEKIVQFIIDYQQYFDEPLDIEKIDVNKHTESSIDYLNVYKGEILKSFGVK